MNILLLITIGRIILHLIIAVTGLILMVTFVQHQPDSIDGMRYILFYCVPVLAAFTVLVSAMTIREYMYPESSPEDTTEE